jgi:phage terminase large subunit
MTAVQVQLPEKLVPVFSGPAMYRGAYGGRGSAKTRSFAKMAAVHGLRCAQANERGVIVCGREFMNSLEESSLAEVKEAILSEPWLAAQYDIGEKFVRTKDRKVDFAFIGLRHNLDSIKSKSRIRLLWVDEAEPVSETAWHKADNTVREEGAEVWVTWNPERKNSATHKRFRENRPPESRIVELNWRDNPWFPKTLDKKRLADQEKRPDQYAHIWEGDFATAVEGAYYVKQLAEARTAKRIGNVSRDPLLPFKAFWDLGVRDATAIWIAQWVGREIRVLDYYEAVGQPLGAHLEWLRSKGYGSALCYLPHDASKADLITATRYEDHIKSAGFTVKTIPNQGKGAALKRVEASRRLFPSIWFNEPACGPGLDALGWYHEKIDEERSVGLGPEHDWSSHGADAFGLMCVAYEEPQEPRKPVAPSRYHGPQSWMSR